jgi:pantothenate synthetase
MAEVIGAEPLAHLDYAAVVDEADLSVPARLVPGRHYRLVVAARLGSDRLIDNDEAVVGVKAVAEPRPAVVP